MHGPTPFPAALPTLRGTAVTLRALEVADIPAWFARASDAEAADLAGDPVATSIEQGAAWLQRQRDGLQRQTALRWAVVPAGITESIGTVGLNFAAPAAPSAELGIVIGRAHWGRGVGTAAARLVLRYAFEVLQLQAVQAEVLERNGASIRLLEKLGFVHLHTLPPTAEEPEVLRHYRLIA